VFTIGSGVLLSGGQSPTVSGTGEVWRWFSDHAAGEYWRLGRATDDLLLPWRITVGGRAE
jgi:hypothetical protein